MITFELHNSTFSIAIGHNQQYTKKKEIQIFGKKKEIQKQPEGKPQDFPDDLSKRFPFPPMSSLFCFLLFFLGAMTHFDDDDTFLSQMSF